MSKLQLCVRMNPNMDDCEKRGHLKGGLLPHFRRAVSGFLPCPLNEMWSKLIHFEADFKAGREDREKSLQKQYEGKQVTQEKGVDQKPQTKKSASGEKEKGNEKGKGNGKGGEKGKSTAEKGKSNQNSFVPIEKVRCYNCGTMGHYSGSCPEPDRRQKPKTETEEKPKNE
jgi:chromatin remodeling complex protein RSC6